MNNNKLVLFLGGFLAGGLAGSTLSKKLISNSTKKIPKLILHVYDHCPYCIRVELVLGWKNLPYERVVYGYGDSLGDQKKGLYYGGKTLTGKKQLPVLELSGQTYMPESRDIIIYLQGLLGPSSTSYLPCASGRTDLRDLFNDGGFKESTRILTRPQVIKLTHLKDWDKPEDIQYAKQKYEGQNFNYENAEKSAEEHIQKVNNYLVKLDELVYSENQLTKGCGQTWDDVVYLPQLRTLTCVKGLKWPPKLLAYVKNSLEKGKVKSYFEY